MISRDDIALVKTRADIGDVISRSGITLKPAGVGSLKGLCPFHDEKSPSFTVRPNNGTYKCFGCGEGGDVFNYLMMKEGLSFSDAIHYVADMYNITITDINGDEEQSGPSKRRLQEALTYAAQFYQNAYENISNDHPAKKELSKRRLDHLAHVFGIGYAPEGWTHLCDTLQEKGFTEEDLLAAGLAVKSENGRLYDFFRGRLTWQIRDIAGKVIGFGARKLFDSDNGGKYLNPMQSVIYDKSHVLYGIDLARASASKNRTLYIVEGYTDVMAYHAVGINNVVATCGTAFGDGHASIARRLVGDTGKLIFGFDGDSAGQKAARKVFSLSSPIHTSSSVIIALDGDPDDIRRNHGDEALREMISHTMPLTEFVLRDELSHHDVTIPEGRADFLNAVAPLLNNITDLSLREDYIRRITLWSGYTLDIVKNKMRNKDARVSNNAENHTVPQHDEPALISRQKSVLAMFLQFPEATYELSKTLDYEFFDAELQPTATEIVLCIQSDVNAVPQLFPSDFSDPTLVESLLFTQFPLVNHMKTAEQKDSYIKRTLETTIKTIKTLRRNNDANALRASINASYGDKFYEDTEVIKDIAERQQALRTTPNHEK